MKISNKKKKGTNFFGTGSPLKNKNNQLQVNFPGSYIKKSISIQRYSTQAVLRKTLYLSKIAS